MLVYIILQEKGLCWYDEYCDPVYARPGPGWHPPCGSRAFQAGKSPVDALKSRE